jgi:hypothetical protein
MCSWNSVALAVSLTKDLSANVYVIRNKTRSSDTLQRLHFQRVTTYKRDSLHFRITAEVLVPMASAAITEVGYGLSLFCCYEHAVILGTGNKK